MFIKPKSCKIYLHGDLHDGRHARVHRVRLRDRRVRPIPRRTHTHGHVGCGHARDARAHGVHAHPCDVPHDDLLHQSRHPILLAVYVACHARLRSWISLPPYWCRCLNRRLHLLWHQLTQIFFRLYHLYFRQFRWSPERIILRVEDIISRITYADAKAIDKLTAWTIIN